MPPKKEELPSTIERSPDKVKRTYEKTLESAHEQYDSEERARRTAWSSVKNVAEKKGDHWEPKGDTGPSDPQAEQRVLPRAPGRGAPSAESTRTSRRRRCSRTPARLRSRAARG